MVAPKVASKKPKEKNDEKKPISASPEPFQEPDGMTTIDLNKSDDYSREIELERAMQKQRAQLRYVTRLIFALGAIFIVVLTTVVLGLANKRYHFFSIHPLQLNESNQTLHPTSSPTEEFVNITRILNQALFRERLKSGTYLDNSYDVLNLCKTRQTLDNCCSVFKNTDLHGLAEYCTVNEMLDILLEYELDRRKKRQVRGYDEYDEFTLEKRPLNAPQEAKYPPKELVSYDPNIPKINIMPEPNFQFNDPNFRHGLPDSNVPHQNIQPPSNNQNNLQVPNAYQNRPFPGPPQQQNSEIHMAQVAANGNLNFPENVPLVYPAPNPNQPEMRDFNSYPEIPKVENIYINPRQNQEFMPVQQQFFNRQPNIPTINFPQQFAASSNGQFMNANSGQNQQFPPQNVPYQNQNYQQQPINPQIESFTSPSIHSGNHLTVPPIPQWANPNPIQNKQFNSHDIKEQPKNPNIQPSSKLNPLSVNLENPRENQGFFPSNMNNQNQNFQPNFPHVEISNINQNSEVPLPKNTAAPTVKIGESEQKPKFIPQIQNQQPESMSPQSSFEHKLDKTTEFRFDLQDDPKILPSVTEKTIFFDEHDDNKKMNQNIRPKILTFSETDDNSSTTETAFVNKEDGGVVLPTSWLKTNRSAGIDTEVPALPGNHPEIEIPPSDPKHEFEKNKFTTTATATISTTNNNLNPKTSTHPTEEIHSKTDDSTSPNPSKVVETPPSVLNIPKLEKDESANDQSTTSRNLINATGTFVGFPRTSQTPEEFRDKAKQLDSFIASEDNETNQKSSVENIFATFSTSTETISGANINIEPEILMNPIEENRFKVNESASSSNLETPETLGSPLIKLNNPHLEKDKSADDQSATSIFPNAPTETFVGLSRSRPTQEEILSKAKQLESFTASEHNQKSMLENILTTFPTSTETITETDENVEPTIENRLKIDESASSSHLVSPETLGSPPIEVNYPQVKKDKSAHVQPATSIYPTDPTETIVGLSRSRQTQEEVRTKTKQMDSFTASEDVQSNQQAYVNPCFYPYMNPYTPYMPPPGRVGSVQEPGFLKVVQVTPQKSQNQPMYVLNPAMYYGMPPSPSPQVSYPNYPSNPYMASGYFPSLPGQSSLAGANSLNSQVQVSSPGGQYFMCNPIPTPTNNIAHLAGVEIRRESSNLQSLMDDLEDVAASNNKSRSASIICPLGEQACLDNSKCIKNYHICDSEVHCDDSSDEIACTCKERVGKLRLCDGYCDCPRCEDEQGCFGCGINEFSCDDWSRFRRSTCIPLAQKCDGIKQCEVTGKDEMDCSMLTDHIGNFPLSKVSNSVGFLHRNYKGKWYPTCFGTELWAAQVCTVEAGPSAMIPKAHMTLTTDPYDGLFINILPNSEVSLVNTCVQDRAAFVECPPIYCGLRFLVNNPYRSEEVDTSIEDMLSDLERAYKIQENGFQRNNLESELDRLKNNEHRSVDLDLGTKRKLDHEHLEEVIENLERTFTRRHVSEDDGVDFILKDSRVVGGKPSQPAAWPWLVSIYKNGIFHCGGVLINELWIITASHCVDRYWQYYYEVQAGALRRFSYSPMDQRRWVTAVVGHEYYSKTNLRNDIALMKLSAPIRYNRYVRPICLPSETTSGKDYLKGPTAGTICTTVGWGATVEHGADPDHMREVEVPILHHCKHKEDSDTEEICAGLTEGGRDACQGDSGGPLMCRNPNNPNQWYLAGIVSHGEGCARPNEPGVYTRVSRYMGWIAENTGEGKVTTTNPLQKCPGYTCKGTKRCVPKKRRCDRIIDCLLGDDEIDCENQFREIFKHSKKSLMPSIDANAYEDYDDDDANVAPNDDANVAANDDFEILESKKSSIKDKFIDYLDDAPKIHTEFDESYFRCKVLLQVIPLEKRCNKVFDCEDGSDETDCTCADYIRTTDARAICDGVTDCMDFSDENNCVMCNTTEYLCPFSQKCIELTKRCDGITDCPMKDDELDCVALTNGQNITLDKDNRPMFKSRGIASINHEGQWKPFCLNKTSEFIGNEAALGTIFCNLLGFDDYLTYRRYRIEDMTINSSYSMISGRVVQDFETKHCENCCDGLYISCSNTSTSTTLRHESLKEVKELYFSPWMAAIYFNGQYKCMSTILDKLWIVTSLNCVEGLHVIKTNYITAVMGKGKLHITERGPHEQIIRVISSININDTDIVLLRLENEVSYNRYVQAADLNVRRDGPQIEKCFAIGQDNDNKVMFVSLAPLKHCLVGYRCFEKKIEEDCQDHDAWSGTIICDTRMGWYPAAVFSEEEGHCGFSHTKKYTSVKFYKNQIFKAMAMTTDPILPPTCRGFQCTLGNCISEEKICNDINDCHNGEDETATLCYEKEKQCHVEDKCVCSATDLKCPTTNKCFPKSSFCDRTNNCGEFEDEPDICSCRNYLKLTNPGKICDGTLNCMDRSDEDPEICSCKLGDFQCGKLNKCVPQELVCDGVEDCPNGEDEGTCLILKTENREKTNAGEVMTRTAGIWHNGCFGSNYTTTQLEQICTKLGFNGGSANQLTPPHNTTEVTTFRPILDSFEVIWLRRQPRNKMKLRMRSGYNPYVSFLSDKDCHRLFIACI